MHLNYLAFAVPLFVFLMLLEYLVAQKQQKDYFNLHASIANVSIGIAERLSDVLVAGLFYFVYDYLQKHFGIFHITPTWWLWIVLLLFTDFIWYWYHRYAHQINIFWAVHVVHHQSEDFNYTVSARITVFQAVVRTAFWCVLPVIGFPASMITVMLLVHGLYPFFVHTRVIGKLGWLEYILVTPSHHRVHHAANEHYLDKNYGDVLIIWDHVFGTFATEKEEPVYGLTEPLRSHSFLWQHFHFLAELWLTVKNIPTLKGKLKTIFGSPNLIDTDARSKAEHIFHINQNEKAPNPNLNSYVVWQIIAALFALFFFILFEHYLNLNFKFLFTLLTVLTLVNCGAIMEQKKWIFNIEFIRMLNAVALGWPFLNHQNQGILLMISAVFIIIVLFYHSVEKKYLSIVYRHEKDRSQF